MVKKCKPHGLVILLDVDPREMFVHVVQVVHCRIVCSYENWKQSTCPTIGEMVINIYTNIKGVPLYDLSYIVVKMNELDRYKYQNRFLKQC